MADSVQITVIICVTFLALDIMRAVIGRKK